MGTEANWLPLLIRTHFSNRLLLSMNSRQSLGSYCGNPRLSRSCAISAQYTKFFTVEKKLEVLLMPVAEEADASTVREEFFFLQSGCQLFCRDRWQTEVVNKIIRLLLGKWMWCIIFKNHFFFVFMSFTTGGIFITNVRKLSEDRHWDFITMSYWKTCWLKIRILEATSVLSVDPSHSAEVTVSDMVFRLPPNYGNSKVQTTLAIGPPCTPCVAPKLYPDEQV